MYSQHCVNIFSSPIACKILLSTARDLKYNWGAVAQEIISRFENGCFFRKYTYHIPGSVQWICYSKYLELSSGRNSMRSAPKNACPHGEHCKTASICQKDNRSSKKRYLEDSVLNTEINADKIFKSLSAIIRLSGLRKSVNLREPAPKDPTSNLGQAYFPVENSPYVRTKPTSSLDLSKMLRELATVRYESETYGCSNYQSRLISHTNAHLTQTPLALQQHARAVRVHPSANLYRNASSPNIFQVYRTVPTKQPQQTFSNNSWPIGTRSDNDHSRVQPLEVSIPLKCPSSSPLQAQMPLDAIKNSLIPQHPSSPAGNVQDLDKITGRSDNPSLVSPMLSMPYSPISPLIVQHRSVISHQRVPEGLVLPQTSENVQYKLMLQQQLKHFAVDPRYPCPRVDAYSPRDNSQQRAYYHLRAQYQQIPVTQTFPQSRRVYDTHPKMSPDVEIEHQQYKFNHQNIFLRPFISPRYGYVSSVLDMQSPSPQDFNYRQQPHVAPAAAGYFYLNGIPQNKFLDQAPLDHTFHLTASTPNNLQYNRPTGSSLPISPPSDYHNPFSAKRNVGRVNYADPVGPCLFLHPQSPCMNTK